MTDRNIPKRYAFKSGKPTDAPGKLFLITDNGEAHQAEVDMLKETDAEPQNHGVTERHAELLDKFVKLGCMFPLELDNAEICALIQFVLDSYGVDDTARMMVLLRLMERNGACVMRSDEFDDDEPSPRLN